MCRLQRPSGLNPSRNSPNSFQERRARSCRLAPVRKCLSRITEYVPADLTVHVEAGVTLEQLQHTLVENNQFLPLDPWNGPTATMGGIAAANAQGPFRAVGT